MVEYILNKVAVRNYAIVVENIYDYVPRVRPFDECYPASYERDVDECAEVVLAQEEVPHCPVEVLDLPDYPVISDLSYPTYSFPLERSSVWLRSHELFNFVHPLGGLILENRKVLIDGLGPKLSGDVESVNSVRVDALLKSQEIKMFISYFNEKRVKNSLLCTLFLRLLLFYRRIKERFCPYNLSGCGLQAGSVFGLFSPWLAASAGFHLRAVRACGMQLVADDYKDVSPVLRHNLILRVLLKNGLNMSPEWCADLCKRAPDCGGVPLRMGFGPLGVVVAMVSQLLNISGVSRCGLLVVRPSCKDRYVYKENVSLGQPYVGMISRFLCGRYAWF